jgi:riboflavin kinase/FMN adenylyltransferase
MRILHSIAELKALPGPLFLAIGVFDGVHLGHQAVINRAIQDAAAHNGRAVVVTFDPHPIRVLRPDLAPLLLTATKHKAELIAKLGVTALLIIPFTKEFAALEARDFIHELYSASQPLRGIYVGHQWSFGHRRSGNLDLLQRLGDEWGFDEVGIPAVEMDGIVVSSTAIRHAVASGELAKAARLLGRPYTVQGTVVEGKKLGRTLGFPTANLGVHNEQLPPDGVYAVATSWNGEMLAGVLNIGLRPTVAEGLARTIEVHLLDFSGDLYGQDLEITFQEYLRGEKKFAGLEALQTQIAEDVANTRRWHSSQI